MWHKWRRFRRIFTVAMCAAIAIVAIGAAPAIGNPLAKTELARLFSMTAKDAAAYVKRHPTLYMSLENADPEVTAKWWNKQTAKYQKDAILDWPDYVGNLEGISYATRDVANRRYLTEAIPQARQEALDHPGSSVAKKRLAALTAIQATARKKGPARRYLVAVSADPMPLAAIAIGNPDTAKLVTFNVPGMGTYTTDMQLWTQTAANVYEAQGAVGAPAKRSVIAWIGYETPPPGIDAALGEYAARGAFNVVLALQGLQAVRGKKAKYTTSIIAHSYGTTTVADALAQMRLGVFSFVMLGSAGIETWIPNARALHTQHVYAGEASGDTEARLGRGSRTDPRSPTFGAIVFAVNGDAKSDLLPVTGHAPALHSPWNDDRFSTAWSYIKDRATFEQKYAAHFTTYGYLDANTESLLNAAIATTPDPTRKIDDTGA